MSKVEHIDAKTLHDWIEHGKAILVDVREIDEYKQAHIPGAILVPLQHCQPNAVPHNPDKKIVFHCKAGKRGGSACSLYAEAMPEKTVYNLDGGIDAWMEEGFEVETA